MIKSSNIGQSNDIAPYNRCKTLDSQCPASYSKTNIDMKRIVTHFILILLLVCYIALGIAGHLIFHQLLSTNPPPQFLINQKSAYPKTIKVYWTQHKHIPSTSRTDLSSTAAGVIAGAQPLRAYDLTSIPLFVSAYLSPIISIRLTRGPPRIPGNS